MSSAVRPGSFRLLRFAGIDVFLNWSWFVVAAIEIQSRRDAYSSLAWNVLEYASLFVIVLMHEFGHALACRQVGGTADHIMLWPLGGVAFVNPPPRPAPTLWSIAAGPLVNVALVPAFIAINLACKAAGVWETMPDAHVFLRALTVINLGLLIFNLLPIYPLDGGQILRALLWFPLGRASSLMVTTIIGFAGVVGLFALALLQRSLWLGILSTFILMQCWRGLKQARALSRLARAPRHDGLACPSCGAAPVKQEVWMCQACRRAFDTFATQGACPQCGARFDRTRCLDCGVATPIADWARAPSAVATGSAPR